MFGYDVLENGFTELSNDGALSVVKIREITNIKEKRKWMEYFRKSYSGDVIALNADMLGVYCRFFVASLNGKDAGFIRITNYTNKWRKYYDGDVWNASDAYVKKPYRGNTVLRQLLEYVIENCNVMSMLIETERFMCYDIYYRTLGFNYMWTFGDRVLCMAVTDKLKDAAIKRNDDFNKLK
jgi:hypothetical protein